MPSLLFKKRAPSLALAAEATMKRRIMQRVKKAPFNLMGSPFVGDHPIRKWPQVQLRALDSKR